MSQFEQRLFKILAEMSELVGYDPTDKEQYAIYYKGELQDMAYGRTPEEAIKEYLNGLIISAKASKYGVTKEQYIAALSAEPDFDYSTSPYLSPTDIKVINLDKTRQTLESWINSNPLPYKFKIVFGKKTVDPTPGAITYVKTGNIGRDPLTPYMILHTLGHAIIEDDTTEVSKSIIKIFRRSALFAKSAKSTFQSLIFKESLIIPLCKLLHMKAAALTILDNNRRGFPTFEELMYDVLAVYVKNGKVKVEPNKYCDYEIEPEACTAIKKILEDFCSSKLDSAVGKVVYDD